MRARLHGRLRLRLTVLIGAAIVFGLPACSSAAKTSPSTTTPLERLALGRASCQPASPLVENETRGTTGGGVGLYGLIFFAGTAFPIHVGDEVKIVWRMTGDGDLTATVTSPAGIAVPLSWGPVAHTAGSSYTRPGDEWGVGYQFTQPGCWQLHLARNNTQGDVWLNVSN